MNKEKRRSKVLKGVTGIGIALGGGNVLGDTNMVYARELEEQKLRETTEFGEEFERASASKFTAVSLSQKTRSVVTESDASEGITLKTSESEAESIRTSLSESVYASESDSASESESTRVSESASASESESIRVSESDSASNSYYKSL